MIKTNWVAGNLNKDFWKESLEGRKIVKVGFNKKGIDHIQLDNGEKLYLNGWDKCLPAYVKTQSNLTRK